MPTKKINKARKAKSKVKRAAMDPDSRGFMVKVREAFRFHGGQPRGSDFSPGPALFEGRFGRMFRTLPPPDFDQADRGALANILISAEEGTTPHKSKPETE